VIESAPLNASRAIRSRGVLVAAFVSVAAAVSVVTTSAQELEPRLYQNSPVGLNAIVLGYGFSAGNILVDSSLPIADAKAKVHAVVAGYLRSFALFGKSAKLDVTVPLSWGNFQGVVAGELRTREPSGLADPRFRLAVNLVGAPALSVREFAQYRQRTILAASVQVAVPLGQYDPAKLVNLGSNRWAFRPELGVSTARERWYFEGAVGAWLFTENPDYYGGSSLTQTPLYFVKGAAIYDFKDGLWLSLSYGFANGGETRIGGGPAANIQRNSRLAVTAAFPLVARQSLKVVWTSGLATRLGADFDSLNVVYQYTWLGGGALRDRKAGR
jgi:Putative MetA-pathway of phenol degradation